LASVDLDGNAEVWWLRLIESSVEGTICSMCACWLRQEKMLSSETTLEQLVEQKHRPQTWHVSFGTSEQLLHKMMP
jgi:hypothetical protein